MQLRALYNLLRFKRLEDPTFEAESWKVEDLREQPTEELFLRLEKLGIPLDEERFKLYAENWESPEELAECLWVKEEEETELFDQTYLLVFELWRRLLPDKQSLSLFCDEVDYRFNLYDRGLLESDEPIQEILEELEDVLDENVDQGGEPQEIFATVSTYCAHDLEGFIYDYIVEKIDAEDELYASELTEGFYEYVADQKWFDFLRSILFELTEPHESQLMLRRLLEQLQEEPDFDLLVEIANYLVHRGDASLFMCVIKQASHLAETQGQFQEVLEALAKYFECSDRDEERKVVTTLCEQRMKSSPDAPVELSDREKKTFLALLNNL